jgi:tetratricopeptide (TPR) repeat protein
VIRRKRKLEILLSRRKRAFSPLALYLVLSFCCTPRLLQAQNSREECEPPKTMSGRLASHPTAAAYDALGGYYGDRKEFACAARAFRESLKLQPNSPQTHYYLALAILAEGDPQNAILELRRSLKLKPDQTEVRLTLGAALSQINRMEEAIQEFQEALRTAPKSTTALDWLAKAYMSEKRYPAAIALLKEAPPDEVLEMDLVMAYSNSGENARALQLLMEMAQTRPGSAVPHSGMGSIYTQERRYEDAAKEFQEALRLNPQDDATLASYIRVLLMQAKFDAALPYADEYWRAHPNDFDAYYLLGVVDRELGKYAEAKALLVQAVKINPEHYAARYNLGLVCAKTGKAAAARTQLEKAIQLDPSSAEAHFQLAAVLRSLSLQDEARAQLSLYQNLMAERDQRDVAAARANEARASLKKGDTQRAADLYREAIEKDSNNSHLYYDFALALERNGDRAGEREAILRAVALDPKFAAAHNQLGLVLLQEGQTAEGEKELKSAISLDPNEVEAHNNLGVLYGQQGKDAEAAQLFQAAIENDPGYAPSYVNLAVALASQSRFSEAATSLKTALQIEPDNKETRALLSQVQSQLGRQGSDHP